MAIKKRGLSRGLSDLLGASESAALPYEEHGQLREVAIAQLKPGKYQPRRDMDLEALEELANSIRSQGIIQPIIVRPLSKDTYEIIAGERRWRAAQLAELTDVPAIVRDIADEQTMALALIENIQREDLNPMEEAMALQRLMEEFNMTHQEVSESVGKARTTVSNILRLNHLTPGVQTLLAHGELERGHAKLLLALDGEQQVEAAEQVITKQLNVRETETLIQRMQAPVKTKSTPSVDPDVANLERRLSRHLSMPVNIKHHLKGHGRLDIAYTDLVQLEHLVQLLEGVDDPE